MAGGSAHTAPLGETQGFGCSEEGRKDEARGTQKENFMSDYEMHAQGLKQQD